MKIVVLDGYTENPGDLSWNELGELGELTVYDRTETERQTIERLQGAEVVITNKTPLTKDILVACPRIRYIAVLATGYNVVDCDYARERGIAVSNVPAYGTASVSQFSIAMLLEICHHIGHHSQSVFSGRWSESRDWCYWDYPLIELYGKTIGIIGFGRIGQAEGRIARALGMKVLAYDIYENEEGWKVGEYTALDTLLACSDVISLHCNLTAKNVHLIDAAAIERMKDGVILLNNARGQLIDEYALAAALKKGKVAAAGLDVVSTEPIRKDNPLLQAPNCLITPHISWAPKESRQRIMDCTVNNVKSYIAGKPQNVVNGNEFQKSVNPVIINI